MWKVIVDIVRGDLVLSRAGEAERVQATAEACRVHAHKYMQANRGWRVMPAAADLQGRVPQ